MPGLPGENIAAVPREGIKRECGTRGDLQSAAVPATVGGEQGFWVGADVRSADHWVQAWEGASEATTREPGDLPERFADALRPGDGRGADDRPNGDGLRRRARGIPARATSAVCACARA